jgi:hypothetical protein
MTTIFMYHEPYTVRYPVHVGEDAPARTAPHETRASTNHRMALTMASNGLSVPAAFYALRLENSFCFLTTINV